MTRFLVVFDVDSTLIQDEVIELLADAAGMRERVAAITESAMRGELDFEASLRERVATLAGLSENVIDETLSRVRPTPGAVELIQNVHERGGKVAAVSGGFSQILDPLAIQLGLDFYRANHLEIVEGKLTGRVSGPVIDAKAKAAAMVEWAALCELKSDRCIAVGDGANDLIMMKSASLSVAFNAKPLVRQKANLVAGAVDLRELITLLP